jgi:hypothetical protein
MYECLYGRTPFCAEDRAETKSRILRHNECLKFPWSAAVSDMAIDLLSTFLSEADTRAGSEEYARNDSLRHRIDSNGDISMNEYLYRFRRLGGRFVFPNDAETVKRHPFFQNINWDKLHECVPPWIPKTDSEIDARYFDEGVEISDFPPELSTDTNVLALNTNGQHHGDPLITEIMPSAEKMAEWYANDIVSPSEEIYLVQMPQDEESLGAHEMAKMEADRKVKKGIARVKEKRARDVILRDDVMGAEAMKARKKGAFWGYTYKRPRGEKEN